VFTLFVRRLGEVLDASVKSTPYESGKYK
jgi:hypothetical protein